MATPRVSPGGAKTCSKCAEHKLHTEFYKASANKDGLERRCKDCYKADYRQAYASDPAKREKRKASSSVNYALNKEPSYARHLRNTYGISLADYGRLLEEQGNGCAVCRKTPKENGKRLAVDHNHSTGEVRGLLCSQCNKGIGNLGDSPDRVLAAFQYLTERGHYGCD